MTNDIVFLVQSPTAFDSESVTYDAIGNPLSDYNGTRCGELQLILCAGGIQHEKFEHCKNLEIWNRQQHPKSHMCQYAWTEFEDICLCEMFSDK